MAKKKAGKNTTKLSRETLGQDEMFEKSVEQELEEQKEIKVECLGLTFENDDERRSYFIEKLREKLKDPEFRKIEGFPIGEDEDILALSDPPYYAACPNPFLDDFIRHNASRGIQGKTYRVEPFSADVSEGKNDPIYNAHSYHTKVPHRAIMRYILHYTSPGDIVFDGFCGTGMTAVACQLSGNPPADLKREIEKENQHVVWGKRRAIICDLSPEATFIAHSLNTPFAPSLFSSAVSRVTSEVTRKLSPFYRVESKRSNRSGRNEGEIVYTIWSDHVRCPECLAAFTYAEAAVNKTWSVEKDLFSCPSCGAELTTRKVQRVVESQWDWILGKAIEISKQTPVQLSFKVGKKRFRQVAGDEDIKKATVGKLLADLKNPIVELERLDRYYKDSLHLRKYTHVHHLYTERTWYALGQFWNEIMGLEVDLRTRQQLIALFTSLLPRLDKLNRYMPDHQRHVGPLVGTLYVSWLSVEISALSYWRDKSKVFRSIKPLSGDAAISTGSCTDLRLVPSESVDYIFTDPPFGHNLQYAELNQRAEAWLRVKTAMSTEAVVSESQKKSLPEYQKLMTRCFSEAYRILKAGRWMTVEFHNSRNAVWNSIQEAITSTGFIIADVRTLNKKKGTTNQLYYISGAVKQDLVITAYKPNGGLEERFKNEAGSTEGVWDFVRTHLRQLPVFVKKDGQSEVIAERQGYLLFDRMVAFHVQRGVSVPLSASEFYGGLGQRFPERDGMFFLPEQAAEYDKRRMAVKQVVQLKLFVVDEASAIQWLQQQLSEKPQTFQELSPQFMREIGGWEKFERPLELMEMLQQNFLCYEGSEDVPSQIHTYLSSNFRELRNLSKNDKLLRAKANGRWFVPDYRKAGDLEKLREKALLKEFWEYLPPEYEPVKQDVHDGYLPTLEPKTKPIPVGKKMKVIRLEAVRTGFKYCWQNKDYRTIIAVAKRIPEDVLQEDPKLLMWYDQAITRSGEEP